MIKGKMNRFGKLTKEDYYNYGFQLKAHIENNNIKKSQEILGSLNTKEASQVLNSTIDGQSPFFLAVLLGLDEFVKYFIGKLNVNLEQRCAYYDKSDTCHLVTPLWCAAVENHLEIADLLVTCNADVDAVSDSFCTAVRAAAVKNHTEMVILLNGWGADINISNIYGGTCLMAAVQNQNFRLCEYLLTMGAKLKCYDLEGNSVFTFAEELEDKDIIKLLSMVRLRRRGEYKGMVLVTDWTELDVKNGCLPHETSSEEKILTLKDQMKGDVTPRPKPRVSGGTWANEVKSDSDCEPNSGMADSVLSPSNENTQCENGMSNVRTPSTARRGSVGKATNTNGPPKPPRTGNIGSTNSTFNGKNKDRSVHETSEATHRSATPNAHKKESNRPIAVKNEKQQNLGTTKRTNTQTSVTTLPATGRETRNHGFQSSTSHSTGSSDESKQDIGIKGTSISSTKRNTDQTGKNMFHSSAELHRV